MTSVVNGQKVFAAGRFFGINNVTAPTPTRFGVPQDQSITFKRSTKSLFGSNQLPEDVSSGTMEVSGKVSLGTLNPRLFADLIFGVTGTNSTISATVDEAQAVPGTSPYTVQVTNHTTFTTDLGVRNATSGIRMTAVASSPSTGQYIPGATGNGTYTFASADDGAAVQISYLYTTASTGELVTMTNQPMGKIGDFNAVMQFTWGAEQSVLTLNSCLAESTELATKLDDYAKPSFSFMAACDNTGTLGTFSFAESA